MENKCPLFHVLKKKLTRYQTEENLSYVNMQHIWFLSTWSCYMSLSRITDKYVCTSVCPTLCLCQHLLIAININQPITQSIYLYCHMSSKIYMHVEWGMVLKAFIIIHTFTITLTGYQCICYNNTIDKPQNTDKNSVTVTTSCLI